nr:DUF406 family protein [Klebsiella pneumoniae]
TATSDLYTWASTLSLPDALPICAAAAAPASEPPQVDYTIVAAGDAVKLDLSIAFSCQAEKIIFELSLRNLL